MKITQVDEARVLTSDTRYTTERIAVNLASNSRLSGCRFRHVHQMPANLEAGMLLPVSTISDLSLCPMKTSSVILIGNSSSYLHPAGGLPVGVAFRPVVHWNRICPSKWTPVYGRIWPTDPTICKGIATRLLHTTYSAECDRTRPSDGLIPLDVFGRRVALQLQANLGLC
jgi:hypothetical protein